MSFTFLQFMGSVKLGDFVSKSNISKALPMTFPLFMEKKVVMLGRPTTGQSGQSGLAQCYSILQCSLDVEIDNHHK